MSIGTRITKLRKRRNLTQEGLAKRVSISRAALSHYEKDRREPDYETLEKLADFFDCTTDYLLGRTEHPNFTANMTVSEKAAKLSEILESMPKKRRDEMEERILAYAKGLADANDDQK